MNNVQKLKKAFFESRYVDNGESETIQLDNSYKAKLIYKEGSETEIEVEDEFGNRFEIKELSQEETNVFLALL